MICLSLHPCSEVPVAYRDTFAHGARCQAAADAHPRGGFAPEAGAAAATCEDRISCRGAGGSRPVRCQAAQHFGCLADRAACNAATAAGPAGWQPAGLLRAGLGTIHGSHRGCTGAARLRFRQPASGGGRRGCQPPCARRGSMVLTGRQAGTGISGAAEGGVLAGREGGGCGGKANGRRSSGGGARPVAARRRLRGRRCAAGGRSRAAVRQQHRRVDSGSRFCISARGPSGRRRSRILGRASCEVRRQLRVSSP